MKHLIVLLLVAGLASGCVFMKTEDVLMAGIGKVTAEHQCPEGEEVDAAADSGCTKIEGQGFTEGFMKFLSDALMLIPRMLAGAAAGAVVTP